MHPRADLDRSIRNIPERRVLRWDSSVEPDHCDMQFRLTYADELLSHRDDGASMRARAPHKHTIRKVFHRQLKNLWSNHPGLSQYYLPRSDKEKTYVEKVADNFNINGFHFVPLVTRERHLICKLEILMLRLGEPGSLFYKHDIDNRLKTLFDSLRMPISKDELGDAEPKPDETPFFVLLEDDSLITHVAVETDTLLDPKSDNKNCVNLLISVNISPYKVGFENLDML